MSRSTVSRGVAIRKPRPIASDSSPAIRLLLVLLILTTGAVAASAEGDRKKDANRDNPESVAALRRLGAGLSTRARHVVSVDLAGNSRAHGALAHLIGLPRLQRLSLRGTEITDADLAALEDLTVLQQLDLTGTKITNQGLIHLRALTKLSVLGLRSTRCTDGGLRLLDGMAELTVLDVNGTQITRAGLRQFGLSGKLPKLAVVDAGNCPVDDRLGTSLTWAESVESAATMAAAESKLLFVLHVSGDFSVPEFT